MNPYNYKRRKTGTVRVGDVMIGGENPVRVQSMTNTSTNDTAGSVAQAQRIAEAGGEIVRLTTQGIKEADNMANIRKGLDERGCHVPLVADVHFNPKVAFRAAETCEKVRINPGNFVDAARTFKKLDYTDEEYQEEIKKIEASLVPFLEVCRKNNTAVRLGVNHGSLSDRIMSRYGDTPAGMVESVMEFLRICMAENFKNVIISIKASNVRVMVETVRLLAKTMEKEGMDFPLHLGVTEAGDGEDGRIKSSLGIGTLLSEGLGDTIRVSLTEDPEKEIPVAQRLRDYVAGLVNQQEVEEPEKPISESQRRTNIPLPGNPAEGKPIVLGHDIKDVPEEWHKMNAKDEVTLFADKLPVIIESDNLNRRGEISSWIDRYRILGGKNPFIAVMKYADKDLTDFQVKAGVDFGGLLLDGYLSGIGIEAPAFTEEEITSVALGLLQGARLRFSKTDYIACPGCGRTLFELQDTLKRVKESTSTLKGLKIGVMGCIVNGPGEMADADYGYVGAAAGKVSLYKGKELVKKNIPSEEAVEELVKLIKENGDWKD